MIWLFLGVLLWMDAHMFKRILPQVRERMGNAGKGVVAGTLLLSIVLMVIGYRSAEVIPVYTPMAGMGHLNNLLMLFSIFLLGAGSAPGVVRTKIRHPMLTGVIVWAVAHLLVNGDLASIILFGGLGLWAIAQMLLINHAEGAWQRPEAGTWARDLRVAVIAIVLYAVIAGIHTWLGYSPFLGTYG
ncbi:MULTISPECIES: NnrU family protein [Halocynthiibacter]|uniref:NnrU family protein n=1 Tax=Halocynthiibacter halioticoli TaxID=2986804 RepID=A0AAE3IX38_9RHOB|nr:MULTISPECIES: NnrU family protein [Halocynthiibacter]MCV6823599.1 NnrU family protein [Halocynthiibacter halioticoli]MCW4056600.1 NnrU family protein [Halocynthiibacter sp. SDUM655004]